MRAKPVVFALLMVVPFVLFLLVALAIFRVVDPQWLDLVFESGWGFFSIVAVSTVGWVVYMIDIWRNPRMPQDKRALWTVVVLAANWYAMPVYFWFYVRNTRDRTRAPKELRVRGGL